MKVFYSIKELVLTLLVYAGFLASQYLADFIQVC